MYLSVSKATCIISDNEDLFKIIDNEVQDVTTTNVDVTTTTLPRIAFNHQSVYDALTQLAELAGFVFYIDVDKDLHFEAKESITSGIILNNTNLNL